MNRMIVQITMALFVLGCVARGEDHERFVESVKVGSGFLAVVAEGDLEPADRGTYTVRVYRDGVEKSYVSGIIRQREGVVTKIAAEKVGEAERIVVHLRSSVSPGYLVAEAFEFNGRSVSLRERTIKPLAAPAAPPAEE